MKLAGESGDVGGFGALGNEAANLSLTAQAIGGPAQERFDVDALGSFQGFELADDLSFAAFAESDFNGAFEFLQIDGLIDAVMGPARPLQSLHLLLSLEHSRYNDDRDIRQKFLEFG